MAKRSRKSSSISGSNSFPTDNSSVDSAWQEALAFRDQVVDSRVKSKKRLAQAQAVRAEAEAAAITATKNYCVDARAQADHNLMEADLTLARTSRLKDDAEKWASSMEEEIQYRLDDASRKRSTARDFAEKIESTARSSCVSIARSTRRTSRLPPVALTTPPGTAIAAGAW